MLDMIFVAYDGKIEDAKQALRNEGYVVGDFEEDPSWAGSNGERMGLLYVDEACINDLMTTGYIDASHNGSTVRAEWP